MFDIEFYMKVFDLKRQLMSGVKFDREAVAKKMEAARSKHPVIYNIETTNACNMRCIMCPRTTQMTRTIETMDIVLFRKIVDQIKPFPDKLIKKWVSFVESKYKIKEADMSENHFFLHIIPRVLVLHGYGDPLLDKAMPERVKYLTKKGFVSYFSCNPANINVTKVTQMFADGLGYIKFSIESIDDLKHKSVRGKASNFSESYSKILELLDIKRQFGYKTVIVITMLRLSTVDQVQEFKRLCAAFKKHDVYIYLKSQDQQWYQDKQDGTQSIHWLEFCQFPWSSMTIKSNGESVECVEDYNNEIILGNTHKESLLKIWNGAKYKQLRQDHFLLKPGIKCTQRCDMRLIGSYFNADIVAITKLIKGR